MSTTLKGGVQSSCYCQINCCQLLIDPLGSWWIPMDPEAPYGSSWILLKMMDPEQSWWSLLKLDSTFNLDKFNPNHHPFLNPNRRWFLPITPNFWKVKTVSHHATVRKNPVHCQVNVSQICCLLSYCHNPTEPTRNWILCRNDIERIQR